jgi:UDP-N-acetylglucosamine transferase subunit ALG13
VIFVTVGTQLPFERLVGTVDSWAGARSPRPDVLAQVGNGRTDYAHVRCERTLDGERYAQAIAAARLMVAHAGTGSILNALEQGVPVIVFPRDDRFGEHRDDHQKQTARQMERMGLVSVAWTESELVAMIDREFAKPPAPRKPRTRNTELVDYLRGWLRDVLDGEGR